MTFDEIPLYVAVAAVREAQERPAAELVTDEQRHEICQLIRAQLPFDRHFDSDKMIHAWTRMRKSPGNKVAITVAVGQLHGWKCFMHGRGRGECSNEVNLDRVVPGCRGGEYTIANCMIMCSFHNCQRGDRTLEEYLLAPSKPTC